jgi:hypothetical protein
MSSLYLLIKLPVVRIALDDISLQPHKSFNFSGSLAFQTILYGEPYSELSFWKLHTDFTENPHDFFLEAIH